jgi:nucleotidyltransferase substrate binding protein (TIGR01987 family)
MYTDGCISSLDPAGHLLSSDCGLTEKTFQILAALVSKPRRKLMDKPDVRWQQRFANYKKALAQLTKFIDKGDLNEFEEQGLIQAFEYTYELAWNVIKDFLVDQGNKNIYGSRDAIREAFSAGLIDDGEGWMDMFVDRNKTSHTYNEDTANEIARNVLTRYFPMFVALRQKLETIISANGSVDC